MGPNINFLDYAYASTSAPRPYNILPKGFLSFKSLVIQTRASLHLLSPTLQLMPVVCSLYFIYFLNKSQVFYRPTCPLESNAQKVSRPHATVFNRKSNNADMPQSKVLNDSDLPKWVKFVSSIIEESKHQNRFQTEECEDKSGEFEYE
jgi:hypothetical protein